MVNLTDKDLEFLFPENLAKYKDGILDILTTYWNDGAAEFKAYVSGGGDDGDVWLLHFYTKEGSTIQKLAALSDKKSSDGLLHDYVWELSQELLGGFHNDEGGGFELEITTEGGVKARGYYNEVVEDTLFTYATKND